MLYRRLPTVIVIHQVKWIFNLLLRFYQLLPKNQNKDDITKMQINIKLSTHVPHQNVWPGVKYLADENHLQNTFTLVTFEFFSIILLFSLIIPLQDQLPELSLLTESNERVALWLPIFIPFWNHTNFVTGLGFDVAIMQCNVYLVFSIGASPLEGVTFGMSISRKNKTRNCYTWKDNICENELPQQQNVILNQRKKPRGRILWQQN